MNEQEQIVERLNRFYREAKLEIPATPPVWTPPGQRNGRWLQPVLVSVALAVVVLSAGFAIKVARDRAAQVRVATTPTVSASPLSTPTATPSATPSPSPAVNWVTQRFPLGAVSTLLLDPSGVFALYAPTPVSGAVDPSKTRIGRVDRSSGAITTGDTFPNATGIASVTGGVWIAAGPTLAPAPTNTQLLTLVDPATLKVKRQLPLPGQTGSETPAGPQLTGSANLLWLGYGNRVYRLDPSTGSTLLSQSLPGMATSISLDPSGQRIYVGIEVPSSSTGQDRVVELDASTGATVASAETGGRSLGGPHVAAASDGVWVSYATGTMGAAEHRSASNLSALPIAPSQNGSGTTIRGSNGIHVMVGGGAVWLVDIMAQQVTCADPTTGAARATSNQSLVETLVADSAGAYLGDNTGIAALQPPASCRG